TTKTHRNPPYSARFRLPRKFQQQVRAIFDVVPGRLPAHGDARENIAIHARTCTRRAEETSGGLASGPRTRACGAPFMPRGRDLLRVAPNESAGSVGAWRL